MCVCVSVHSLQQVVVDFVEAVGVYGAGMTSGPVMMVVVLLLRWEVVEELQTQKERAIQNRIHVYKYILNIK